MLSENDESSHDQQESTRQQTSLCAELKELRIDLAAALMRVEALLEAAERTE